MMREFSVGSYTEITGVQDVPAGYILDFDYSYEYGANNMFTLNFSKTMVW